MNEAVHTIMKSDLVTITPDINLTTVRKIFLKKRIHHLPVIEGKKLVGLLTTYDLWRRSFAPSEYDNIIVKDVMSTDLAKIGPDDKIGSAAEVFLDNRFHALPVVNDKNDLIGMITSFDVMLYEFKKAYPNPILFKHLFEPSNPKEEPQIGARRAN